MSESENVSQDMFDESPSSQSTEKDVSWRGVSLSELKWRCKSTHPYIRPSSFHSVLFKLPQRKGEIPTPYPEKTFDFWDNDHVRLPNSPRSLFPVSGNELKPKWRLVCKALEEDIASSHHLERAIFSYNSKANQKWSLTALHHFFSEVLDDGETQYFFDSILPGIIQLALSLPNKIKGGIPLLKRHCTRSVSLSQDQASCLMANAFLCTFPRRSATTSFNPFPSINFIGLFQCGNLNRTAEKLKCLINYFRRVITKGLAGVITYSRHYIEPLKLPKWEECQILLPKMHIDFKGTIEDEGNGMMEVDFANKFVGGGVLGRGSVQEEIKFLICPELLISRLITECLDDTEALIVTGCERFNRYVGYGETFTWAGDFIDSEARDHHNRKLSTIVAIDATHFNDVTHQYSPTSLRRELNKAFVGFSFGSKEGWNINVATGNWGCGAFRGEPRVKALIQLMAAAAAQKSIAYFTFQDKLLRDSIYEMYTFLVEHEVTVGTLWDILIKFHDCSDKNLSLYDFIYNMVDKEGNYSHAFKVECRTVSKQNINPKNELELSEKEIEEALKCSEAMEISEDDVGLTDADIQEALKCAEEIEKASSKTKQPVSAESYSIKTEAGRKRCIEIEKERWKAYEMAKKELSPLENTIDDSTINNNSSDSNTPPAPKIAIKRKISDYFVSTSK